MEGILEFLENIIVEEATRRVRDRKLYLLSTLTGKRGKIKEEDEEEY